MAPRNNDTEPISRPRDYTMSLGMAWYKFQTDRKISNLERKKKSRKQQFGLQYIRLAKQGRENTPEGKRMFRDAMRDISSINREIKQCREDVRNKTIDDINRKVIGDRNRRGKKGPNGSFGPEGKRGGPNRLPKQVIRQEEYQRRHSPEGKRARLSFANLALTPENFHPGHEIDRWTHSVWTLKEYQTSGGWTTASTGVVEVAKQKSIQRGLVKFKAHPQLYVGMMYPKEMLSWRESEQEYTLIYRDGTTGLKPKNVKRNGPVTLLVHEYTPLPPFRNNELPKNHRDKYTDEMTYQGKKLITKQLPAHLPGRGTGLMDDPSLKLMGDHGAIDPSDIAQGAVGDCWLLSAIAALAEFEGAIARLFRNTIDLKLLPYVDGRPNKYTITLWDLKTWKEVDITVDERLPVRKDPPGALFGAKATLNGELWVAYLEKAVAAHCGGWDAIDGGQCTHAWSLLTGCRQQYIIQRVTTKEKKKPVFFEAWAKYDTHTNQWADHENSPKKGNPTLSKVDWPRLGGGGSGSISEDALFSRMCIWNENNFLLGASSMGESDKNMTNGVVDNHAYSVIECRKNVAGTGISMARVRNPWGYGGIEKGLFARGGDGWKKYPQIRTELEYKELEQDDGVFWVTKDEFFKHYRSIYLGAMDMHKFLGISKKSSGFSPSSRKKEPTRPVMTPPKEVVIPSAPSMDSESDTENDPKSRPVVTKKKKQAEEKRPKEQAPKAVDMNKRSVPNKHPPRSPTGRSAPAKTSDLKSRKNSNGDSKSRKASVSPPPKVNRPAKRETVEERKIGLDTKRQSPAVEERVENTRADSNSASASASVCETTSSHKSIEAKVINNKNEERKSQGVEDPVTDAVIEENSELGDSSDDKDPNGWSTGSSSSYVEEEIGEDDMEDSERVPGRFGVSTTTKDAKNPTTTLPRVSSGDDTDSDHFSRHVDVDTDDDDDIEVDSDDDDDDDDDEVEVDSDDDGNFEVVSDDYDDDVDEDDDDDGHHASTGASTTTKDVKKPTTTLSRVSSVNDTDSDEFRRSVEVDMDDDDVNDDDDDDDYHHASTGVSTTKKPTRNLSRASSGNDTDSDDFCRSVEVDTDDDDNA